MHDNKVNIQKLFLGYIILLYLPTIMILELAQGMGTAYSDIITAIIEPLIDEISG